MLRIRTNHDQGKDHKIHFDFPGYRDKCSGCVLGVWGNASMIKETDSPSLTYICLGLVSFITIYWMLMI